jgi:hypothetical protein
LKKVAWLQSCCVAIVSFPKTILTPIVNRGRGKPFRNLKPNCQFQTPNIQGNISAYLQLSLHEEKSCKKLMQACETTKLDGNSKYCSAVKLRKYVSKLFIVGALKSQTQVGNHKNKK